MNFDWNGDRLYYTLEKLAEAVYVLVGKGSLKERLFEACIFLVRLTPQDFPEHLQGEYSALWEAFTWLPPEEPSQGAIRATLAVMSEEEADALAKRILELYQRMNAVVHEGGPPTSGD